MARIIDQQKKNLIGERVRFYRIQRGYSQQQLADKLETLAVYICRGSISRIEDYSRTVTDLDWQKFCKFLFWIYCPNNFLHKDSTNKRRCCLF